MNISGKVALVSGGASGLGAASVKMILDAGGRVAILDRNEELGRKFAAECGDSAQFFAADVTDSAGVQRAVDGAVQAFGALHLCLNCAGIGDPQKVIDKEGPASLEKFVQVIQVNLIGTFNVARLAAWAIARNEPNNE